MLKRLMLLCLLLSVTTLNAHAWSEEPEKYQSDLYPDGMPTKEYKDGISRESEYEFLGEAQFNENEQLVVYVEKYPATMDDYFIGDEVSKDDIWILEGEYIYKAFMVIINKEDNKVIFRKEFSGIEAGGPFVDAYATPHVFPINKYLNAIHVDLATQISGTGHGTYTDDWFFIFNNNDFDEILKINDSEFFWKSFGEDYTLRASMLCVADIDSDDTNEILLRRYINEQEDEKETTSAAESLEVYKFDDVKNEYERSGTVLEVPEKNIVLRERYPLPQ